MKLKYKLIATFCFSMLTFGAHAQETKLICETVSATTIVREDQYQHLKEKNYGQHQTIIKFENLPEVEHFELVIDRPVLNETEVLELPRKNLLETGEIFGDSVPTLILSGLGYLPGEGVFLKLQTKAKKVVSDSIEIVPNPILKASPSGSFYVGARMVSRSPETYVLTFEGAEEGAEYKIDLIGPGQSSAKYYKYDKNNPCFIRQGPDNDYHGGAIAVMVSRSNEDFLQFLLPWGTELEYHKLGFRVPVTYSFANIKYQRN